MLQFLMDDAIAGINGKPVGDFFPDLVYRDIKEFISRPGCEMVRDWVPCSAAERFTAEDWSDCDDEVFKLFGFKTRIIKLFFREFLRHTTRWIETTNPEWVEPEVAAEMKNLLVAMDPPKEPNISPRQWLSCRRQSGNAG